MKKRWIKKGDREWEDRERERGQSDRIWIVKVIVECHTWLKRRKPDDPRVLNAVVNYVSRPTPVTSFIKPLSKLKKRGVARASPKSLFHKSPLELTLTIVSITHSLKVIDIMLTRNDNALPAVNNEIFDISSSVRDWLIYWRLIKVT